MLRRLSTWALGLVVLASALLVDTSALAANRFTKGRPASGAQPYTWYQDLDKTTVTFTAAGAWGSALAVQEAAAPSVLTSVTASTVAELETALLAGARTVTIGADINCGVTRIANGTVADVDIVIPPGRLLRSCIFSDGAYTNNARVRFRGNTVGSYSGGQLHNITFWGCWNDLIFDGVGITGPGRDGTTQQIAITINDCGNRVAFTNVLGMAGNEFYTGNAKNVIVTGSSIYSGAESVAEGQPGREAWGFRLTQDADGGIIFYRVDIRGTRYHRIRLHPTSTTGYLWISESNLVDSEESKVVTVDTNLVGSMPKGYMAAMWFTGNGLWMTGGGCAWASGSTADDGTHGVIAAWTPYVRSSGNTTRSDTCTSDASFSTTGSTDVVKSGNTYLGTAAAPAWRSGTPGNPTGLNWNIGPRRRPQKKAAPQLFIGRRRVQRRQFRA